MSGNYVPRINLKELIKAQLWQIAVPPRKKEGEDWPASGQGFHACPVLSFQGKVFPAGMQPHPSIMSTSSRWWPQELLSPFSSPVRSRDGFYLAQPRTPQCLGAGTGQDPGASSGCFGVAELCFLLCKY